MEVTFQVSSHEGSVVLSNETSLGLSSIEPCSNLDQIPDSENLICSIADHPMKRKNKNSATKCVSQEKYVNQCVLQGVQEETSKQECQAHVICMDDKNCLSTVSSDKNCQDTQCIHM